MKNSEDLNVIRLTATEYFDTITGDENFEEDGIAKYDKAYFYVLDHNPQILLDNLEQTTLELSGTLNSDFVVKTNYYGNETEVVYRKDKNGFELIIQSIRVANNCIVITRMERPNNFSEWTNINLNIGLNYRKGDSNQEKWYSPKNGDFIMNSIIDL